jgi:hypothetical protein
MTQKHFSYKGPGKYIAICNNTNFDGHYIKHFEVPNELPEHLQDASGNNEIDIQTISASWYFLNVIDHIACVEAVYPLSLIDTNETLTLLKQQQHLKTKEIVQNPPWLAK